MLRNTYRRYFEIRSFSNMRFPTKSRYAVAKSILCRAFERMFEDVKYKFRGYHLQKIERYLNFRTWELLIKE